VLSSKPATGDVLACAPHAGSAQNCRHTFRYCRKRRMCMTTSSSRSVTFHTFLFAVYPDGRVCISILHSPGDDPNGYETAAERWSPVQSVSNSYQQSITQRLSIRVTAVELHVGWVCCKPTMTTSCTEALPAPGRLAWAGAGNASVQNGVMVGLQHTLVELLCEAGRFLGFMALWWGSAAAKSGGRHMQDSPSFQCAVADSVPL
jgi:hypothetical protein